jgi:chromosome segregation ATPase
MKTTMFQRRLAPVVFLLAAATLIGETAETGHERAESATTSMEVLRGDINRVRDQVSNVLGELNGLQQEGTDLRVQFKKFVEELGKTEAAAKITQQEAEDMARKGDDYFHSWEKDSTTINNPDIRKTSEKRHAKLFKSYKKIEEAMQESKPSFEPFLSDLKDVKKYLENDLTPSGVKAAKSIVRKANWDGETVQKKLDRITLQLNRVSSEMSMR